MKKNFIWLLICLLIPPIISWAYVSLDTYSSGETLTALKLNTNQNTLNTGLDNLQIEMQDSIAQLKTAIRDSGFAHRIELNDTINNRLYTVLPIFWTQAFGDSIYAGDSLTVEISKKSPLGDAQGIFVKSSVSVIEKVKIIIDYLLPNNLSKVDSLRTKIWTERTDGTDFVAFYVNDDSTTYAYKVATDSTGSKYSATARTALTISQAISTNTIVGGKLRVSCIVQTTNSDSLFVGPLELIVSNR